MKDWKLLMRRGAIAVYALAIPICILVALLGLAMMDAEGRHHPLWPVPVVAAAVAALLIWRLRLNLRIVGQLAPGGSEGVASILGRGVLAVCGAALILAAVAYAGLTLWIMFGTHPAILPDPTPEDVRKAGSVTVLAIALFASALGMVMIWPLLSLLRRRVREPS